MPNFFSFNRRIFLRSLALLAGSAVLASQLKLRKSLAQWHSDGSDHSTNPLDDLNAVPNPSKPLKFVILGAGMAGLCAAYELEKRGHTCVILEAERSHIGGRIRTMRFGEGLYGEAGAMRIPEGHNLTRHYIKELGLDLRPFVMGNPEAYYYMRGEHVRAKNLKNLGTNYTLIGDESQLTPEDIWTKAAISRINALTKEEIADLRSDSPKTETLRTLDREPLGQLFYDAGFSEEAIEWFGVTYGLEAFMSTSALEHIREQYDRVWIDSFDEIVGGTERLPLTMVDKLKSKPRMGCKVSRLERDDQSQKAAAVYLENGKTFREEGDFVLCTIPFPVLARLDTPFSATKHRAIRNLHYNPSVKVFAITKGRFWEADDGIFGGGTFSDLPIASTYYPSDNAEAKDPKVSANPGVMLASYTWGDFARRLGNLPPQERHGVVQKALGELHPQINEDEMLQRMVSWNWDNYIWSGGAYAFFMPGQYSALYQHIVAPEGRIFFAGEHASLDHSWIQGALKSSLRAVKEMLLAAQ
ncbi:MAG: FAD-dependent oxidoreductase [Xenococcaceae cyanobacterium]